MSTKKSTKPKATIFIGEYFLSFPGGAERSMYAELQKKANPIVISFDKNQPPGTKTQDNITIHNHKLKYTPPKLLFRFLSNYSLNKHHIFNTLESYLPQLKNAKDVYIQALFAPLVAEFLIAHNIPYTYFARDELQYNKFTNYETGWKKLAKDIKDFAELSSIQKYKNANIIALKNAKRIIANSQFMKAQLEKYNKNITVILPKITKPTLKSHTPKYIVFLGGSNPRKGADFVEKLAKKLPQHTFCIFGPYEEKHKSANKLYHPHTKNVEGLLKNAKLVIVPSVWDEAYGRIAKEAELANIPVLVSNKGGLPEAVTHKKAILPLTIERWQKEIQRILKNN